jgi:flagellar assembly factor FliW
MPENPQQLAVTRFGQTEQIEVIAGEVLSFPHGLIGMEHLWQFVIVDDSRIAPCRWLQSLQVPALAFVIADPRLVLPEYVPHLPEEDAADLELEDNPDVDVWALLTIHPDPAQSTANLLAPIVVNRRTRRGKQVILSESRFALRHPLPAV